MNQQVMEIHSGVKAPFFLGLFRIVRNSPKLLSHRPMRKSSVMFNASAANRWRRYRAPRFPAIALARTIYLAMLTGLLTLVALPWVLDRLGGPR